MHLTFFEELHQNFGEAPQKTYVPWGPSPFLRSFTKINKQKGNNFISNNANFSSGLYIVYIYYSISAYNKSFGIFIYNFTCLCLYAGITLNNFFFIRTCCSGEAPQKRWSSLRIKLRTFTKFWARIPNAYSMYIITLWFLYILRNCWKARGFSAIAQEIP